MVLFKKPNRKFRQRVAHSESEDEAASEETSEKNERKPKDCKPVSEPKCRGSSAGSSRDGSTKEEKPESQPAVPATKLLSFHDEEDDGEVFKLKKSNYSRRLAKKLEKERKKRQENPDAPQSSADDITVLKQSFKSDTTEKNTSKSSENILSGKDAEDMDVVDEDDNESQDEVKENPFKDVLQSGVIPDAATIYAMKKHRQLAREMGDFIPLEDPERNEEKSRLVRDDDNDRSDDDDDEPSRLSFTVNTGAMERQKVREAFLSLQEEAGEELENEDAAELERWEREQIRKGVSIVQSGQPQPPQIQDNTVYSYAQTAVEDKVYSSSSTSDTVQTTSSASYASLQSSHKSELTTASIKSRLEERLASLKEIHCAHKQELEQCKKEMKDAAELVQKIETEAPELARRYALYQQMRGYVRDLVECLDLKVAHIELLDSRLMDLYKERAQSLVARRQQDVRDQSDECSLMCSKLIKGSNSEVTCEKAAIHDEAKLRRAAEREGRRIRRRKLRERSLLPVKHHEGMSSDDEEPEIDVLKFKEKREAILRESKDVFDDVIDEFGTLQGVMATFERWKEEQPESYAEAFVPLCLPKIFGPFVRIEMLSWNPLEDETNVENTEWYRALTFYGLCGSRQKEEVEAQNDPDIGLLPSIVEKILLPKVTAFVKDVWDPVSTKQTSKLVNLIKKFCEEYPSVNGKSKHFQALLHAVCSHINKSVADDVFIPWYPGDLLENRSLATSVFFQRQFWTTVKLFINIVMWDGVLAEQPLQEMALSSLLSRYILMGLNTSTVMKDTLEKCKIIVGSFPKSWFNNVKGCKSLPQLLQFSQYLVKYGLSFSTPMSKRSHSEEEQEVREMIKEIIQLMISMNSLDDAVVLAKEFSISGFKKNKPP